ncbi:MAG: hypothetical protein ABW007_00070 [Chitinophagaceae bacterium]
MLKLSPVYLEDCGYYFLIVAGKGDVLFIGELLRTVEDCEKASESLKECCGYEYLFDLYTERSKIPKADNIYYYTACDKAGRMLGRSSIYGSEEERDERLRFLRAHLRGTKFLKK